jgi:hypothetical protein
MGPDPLPLFRKLTFCSSACIAQYKQQAASSTPLRNVPDKDDFQKHLSNEAHVSRKMLRRGNIFQSTAHFPAANGPQEASVTSQGRMTKSFIYVSSKGHQHEIFLQHRF